MNSIWFRLAPHRDWQRLSGEVYGPHVAQIAAKAVESALKMAGHNFAQAEARDVDLVAGGIVPAGQVLAIGEHFPDQEAVAPPLLTCAHCGMWVGHAPGCPKIAHLPPGVNMR